MLVPSTGQIKNRRGCRGFQLGVVWQDCPVEIDGLSPLQKREHSQGPLPNPSWCSGLRFPSLAPSPCPLLLICGISWLCAGAFNPQQENRRHSETSLAFQTGSVCRGAQSTVCLISLLLRCRPGSSSIERPSLQRQALKSSRWSTRLISHT